MLMGDLCDFLNVDDVGVRVAEGLDVERLGVGLDGGFKRAFDVRVDECGGNAGRERQRMRQQVISAAVDGLGGDDMLTGLGQREKRVVDGGCAGCDSQSGCAALERSNALLEDRFGRVRQTAVDVACVLQCEAVRRVLRVVEDIGRAGVDGDGSRVRNGIGLLLTDMKLQGLEFILAHNNTSFLNFRCLCG